MKFGNIQEFRTNIMNLDMADERLVLTRPLLGITTTPSERYKGIWNVDFNALSCITSKRYRTIQHTEAFSQVADVLQELGIDIEGNIRNLRDTVVVEIIFKGYDTIPDGQKGVKFGIKIGNSYDRTKSFFGELWAYRLVCSNGMVLGKVISNDVRLKRKHMGIIDIKTETRKFIRKAIQSQLELKELISNAMADTLEWEFARNMLNYVIDIKKYRDMVGESLRKVYDEQGSVTRWDVYNCITYLATHGDGESLKYATENYLQNKAQQVIMVERDVK